MDACANTSCACSIPESWRCERLIQLSRCFFLRINSFYMVFVHAFLWCAIRVVFFAGVSLLEKSRPLFSKSLRLWPSGTDQLLFLPWSWKWAIPKGNEKVFQPSIFRCELFVSGSVLVNHNHGSVENCLYWKVAILLEIHPFFTEPWLWEVPGSLQKKCSPTKTIGMRNPTPVKVASEVDWRIPEATNM